MLLMLLGLSQLGFQMLYPAFVMVFDLIAVILKLLIELHYRFVFLLKKLLHEVLLRFKLLFG